MLDCGEQTQTSYLESEHRPRGLCPQDHLRGGHLVDRKLEHESIVVIRRRAEVERTGAASAADAFQRLGEDIGSHLRQAAVRRGRSARSEVIPQPSVLAPSDRLSHTALQSTHCLVVDTLRVRAPSGELYKQTRHMRPVRCCLNPRRGGLCTWPLLYRALCIYIACTYCGLWAAIRTPKYQVVLLSTK